MNRRILPAIAVFALCCLPRPVQAQGTAADYERAAGLRQQMQGKVLNARVSPRWLDEGKALWYRLDEPGGGHRWIIVDARTGESSPAFDHERLAAALAERTGNEVQASSLPIERLVIEGERMVLLVAGQSDALVTDRQSIALEAADTEMTSKLGGRPVARFARSVRTGQESGLIFVNRTEGPIKLVWRDTTGRAQEYGTVAAGEQFRQQTYEGHVWEVLGAEGARLGLYQAQEEPVVVVVEAGGAEEGQATSRPTTRQSTRPTTRESAEPAPGRRVGRDGGSQSPDGRFEVTFEEHNARLRSEPGGEAVDLTTDGVEALEYRGPVFWSPDSRYVAFMKHKAGGARKVYYVESSPRDQLQPKLESYDYLKPGDPIPQDRPVIFDVTTGKPVEFEDALFDNPWSISQGHWSPDGSEFRFLYNQRGHQVVRLIGVSTKGKVRTIIEETSPTFIDYSQKTYLHRLPETDQYLWASERDGWNHLYLYDAKTAESRQVTRGEWVVREVDRVDAEKKQLWFRAGGVRPEQDPYHLHYCRVNFDGSELVVLTEGDGTHSIQPSPDGETFVDTYSRVDLPPVTELRRSADGALVATLASADASELLSAGWKMPERFVAKGRDGETDIWGIILRPSNFDPAKKYPVIESIYAGPHGAHVPKEFRSHYGQQELAELGFILVQIDGMGTNHRGKKFHDVAWKNIADAGFPDRKLWIRAAAEHEPAMDIERVGIYGGSAGGQNAMRAVLDHHDLYDVAIADCGCHDNRMDKIWWNEAWMGWPVDESYEKSSNVVDAHKLGGKLLLIVGEADENVDPASTLQVVDALIRADKDFEFLMVPGAGHGAMGNPYARRRAWDFFVRHLLGVEPRHESEMAAQDP